MKTHYATLDVPPGVETAPLRNAWLRLGAKYHPDRNPKDAAKMTEINVAYAALRDKKTRAIYDLIHKIEPLKCVRCKGRGDITTSNFLKSKRSPCNKCNGTGWGAE